MAAQNQQQEEKRFRTTTSTRHPLPVNREAPSAWLALRVRRLRTLRRVTDPTTDTDLPEQMRIRRAKRDRMLIDGVVPYPATFPRTATLAAIRRRYADLPADTKTGDKVAVAGRVMFLRDSGKLCFATLHDGDGTDLQVMISLGQVGAEQLEAWKRLVDIGDHVGVVGEVVTSRRGELSTLATSWVMTSKALRPLPVAHRPMNEEARVRQRYVDLIVRPEAQAMVRARAAIVRSLRDTLHGWKFVEVETPMLHTIPGGAAARPFITRSNALDTDLYLRIAPELFLKRCVVGGLERVFEINRNFRNEGVDSSHSPEFTMLEAYQTYADYRVMAVVTRSLIVEAGAAFLDAQVGLGPAAEQVDLFGQWRDATMYGLLSDAVGEEITARTDVTTLNRHAQAHGLDVAPTWGPGKVAEELFEKLAVPHLQQPTFVYDYPVETSPLVRAHPADSHLVEKWDLYMLGTEIATGYSELVDPVVQRRRLSAQARLAARGDDEAMRRDDDFLRALEYGMPPTGGIGLGVDRLLMAFTGRGIRETILFPLTRPERVIG
jgi:lysyl-tRNA synthetase class 2